MSKLSSQFYLVGLQIMENLELETQGKRIFEFDNCCTLYCYRNKYDCAKLLCYLITFNNNLHSEILQYEMGTYMHVLSIETASTLISIIINIQLTMFHRFELLIIVIYVGMMYYF